MFARKLFDRLTSRNQRSTTGRKSSKKARRAGRSLQGEQLEERRLLIVGAFGIPPAVAPGEGYDGVVAMDFGSNSTPTILASGCTASLLTGGRHVVTAAHCTDFSLDGTPDFGTASIVFDMPDQNYVLPVTAGNTSVPEAWTGSLGAGGDLAIIELSVIAPWPAERYRIFRGDSEAGQRFVNIGYGNTGTGATGSLPGFSGGVKRIGHNEFVVNGNLLESDFDDGTLLNDTLGDGTGLGESETTGAQGDSGSPAFLGNSLIAGLNSFTRSGFGDSEIRDDFGDQNAWTRVSMFAAFIDSVLQAPADITLDMNFQPVGNNGVPDTITARHDPANMDRLQLLINGQEVWSDLLSRVDSLTLIGSGDDDTFVIDGDFDVDITVDGGLGYDSLEIIGTGVGTATYTPSATTTGDGTVVIGGDTITFSNFEPLTVSNVPALTLVTPGSEDRVLVENTDTLGQIRVSGTSDGVVFESLTFFDVTTFTLDTGTNDGASPDDIITLDAPLPASGLTTFNILAGAGTDRVLYNGTAWDDTFEVTATGVVTLANASGSRLTVSSTTGVEQLVLIGLDGDDIFHVPGEHPLGSILVEGGNPSASDVLNFNGSGAGAVTIDLQARTVTQNGFGPVSFSGVEVVNVEANNDLTVLGTAGDDQISYTPTGTDAGTLVLAGLNAVFHVSAVGVLSLDPLGGTDTVTVHGNSADNDITVDRDAPTTVQVDGLLAIDLEAANTEALVVSAGLGDDTIAVTGTGGPALTVDGGPPTPGDTLAVETNNVTVTFGGDLTSGVLGTTGGDINFSGISTIELTGDTAGTLTINGTNGDDAINQNDNTVTVNNSAVVKFVNYHTLNLNGANGSDTFNVHPATLAGVSALNIDGGDPTAGSDTVIVNGTPQQDQVDFAPGAADAMTITGLGPSIVLDSTQRVIYNGQGGQDELTYTTPLGHDEVVFSPGSWADSGTIEASQPDLGGNTPLLTLTYQNVGANGTLTFAATGFGDGVEEDMDWLVVRGTDTDDRFVLTSGGQIQIVRDSVPSSPTTLLMETPGISRVLLQGLDGDDAFHIAGDHPFESIAVEGGSPSASDVLNFTGSGAGAVTIDLQARTVTENGSGPVAFSGVEIVNVEANNDLTVLGTAGDDQISYTPTGADAGTLVLAGLNAVFHVSAVSVLSLDPLGGTDTVTVHGNSADNDITVDRGAPTTVQVDGLLAIELEAANTEALVVSAGLGDDTITVTGTGTGGPALTVDGGPPTPGDTLNVETIDATVTFGGDLTSGVLGTTGGDINFSGISTIELTGDTTGTLTINGTNGDDAINQNGNTVTVNNSAVVNFAGYYTLNLNGANGSDTFNVHPATLAGVSALNIDGGDPTASDLVIVNVVTAAVVRNLSVSGATITDAGAATVNVAGAEHLILVGDDSTDLTVEGTAGDDRIVHSPGAAADAGAVRVDSLLPISYQNLGVGAALTIDGLDGNDTLVVEGTAADDRFGVAGTSGDVSLNSRVVISQDSIENLVLRGLDGDDVFSIAGDHPFDSVRIEGGNPSASDVLNLGGSGGAVEVALDAFPAGPELVTTITEAGFGPVILSGVEIANIDANSANLSVAGTRLDDVIQFTPLSGQSGTVTANRVDTVFHFTGVPAANGFAIAGGPTGLGGPAGGGFADKVIFHGTAGRDLIRVDVPNRFVELDILNMAFPPAAIATWRGVTLDDNIELVEVRGQDGRDTFHVVPGPAVGNGLFVKIDGGSPLASDALLITDLNGDNQPVPLAATDFVVVGKSRVPDAGNVLVFREAQRLPDISYENVEILWANINPIDPNTGEPNLLIVGPDLFEPNEYRATAAFLGSGSTINVQNLAIFPNAHEHIGLPADRDYFRVVAQQTGTLDFQIYFRTFDPGLLPGGGQLTIDVLDVGGNPISGFSAIPGNGDARARIPVVAGQTYYLLVRGENEDVVNGYDLTILNAAPPVPYDIELQDLPVGDPPPDNSDTGRSQFDNVTRDNTPTIWFRLDDAVFLHDLPGNPAPGNPPAGVITIPSNGDQAADPTEPGYRVAVFVEGLPQQPGQLPQQPVGYARQVAEGVYEFSFETDALSAPFELTEGSHFISARVQMIDPANPLQTGFGARSASLEIIVDTVPPPVSFGMPTVPGDGLHPDSDSGVAGPNNQATLSDRVTNDTTPTFWGRAEANAIVRAYLDVNENGVVDDGDVFVGMTVAAPLDGSNQFPGGYWQLTSVVDMNDPATSDLVGGLVALPLDGLRRILVTAEDVAGNVSAPQTLDIFIDTQGPQITAVSISGAPDFDLFDVKPSQGPTPLVRSLTIDVRDLPARVAPEFLYAALASGTDGNPVENPGHYHLVGDHNGVIVIESVDFIPDPDPAEAGQPATGRIVLTFADPLPDDRFTLTISDALVDPAGNALDGESNAVEPNGAPQFPSGDGQAGGPFVARFTVDSRAEIGVWAAGSVYVDTNGNFIHDPTGKDGDFTNRDITYMFGLASDNIIAGNFADPGTQADGFHKLAAYGRYGGTNRWLIDTDNNGVPNWNLPDSLSIDGLPLAGRFWDGVVRNGIDIDPNSDQVGVKKGTTWYLDTNANLIIDAGDVVLAGNMPGMPIVGDFDGDGIDDLGSWVDDVFYLNLSTMLTGAPNLASYHPNINGIWDVKFDFGLTGVRERPFAADFDGDGFDDIGLWVPDRSGATPVELAEWYILTSGEEPLVNRIEPSKATGRPTIHFTPRPFGNDIYAQFGDNFALPVVGNFDPPVVPFSGNAGGPLTDTNLDHPLDVNADGVVTPLDALLVINTINRQDHYIAQGAFKFSNGIYPDVNGDSWITPLDALLLVNHLNRAPAGGVAAEGESSDLPAMLGLADQPLTVAAVPAATGAWSQVATSSAEGAMGSGIDPADGFVDLEAGSAADVLFAELGNERHLGGGELEDDPEDLLSDIAGEVDRWWKAAV